MSKCHHIFTHNNLDGAISLLIYLWSNPSTDNFHYTPVSNLEIHKIKNELKNSHNSSNFVLLDLPLREEFLPELDNSYTTIIDHHQSSEKFLKTFTNSKVLYKDYSSNSLLMYKMFKDKFSATDSQKTLVALADDYDSYKFELKNSSDLNIIFWTEYQNRFSDFIKDYYNGFKPFSDKQKKAIEYVRKEAELEISKSQKFLGSINFGGKIKKTCAILAEKMNTQVMEILIKSHKPDLFFFINMKSETVLVRQCTYTDPIDCSAFVEKLCDGKGHNNSAVGKITPLFMEVAKNLTPLSC